MVKSEVKSVIARTQRTALYLWAGLSLSLTLFYVQSQIFFVRGNPLPTQSLEWVFVGLGVVTFILGVVFFPFYTKVRKAELGKMPPEERRQQLLIAFVLQFIFFETLGLYGVLLAVLTQAGLKAVPFLIFAYLGFALAFPKKGRIAAFF